MGEAHKDGKGTEVELKLRVPDLAGLMRIAAASGGTPEDTAHQTNRYLDTQERALNGLQVVLRLRTERTPASERWFLTAKGPTSRAPSAAHTAGLTTVQEEEVELSAEDGRAVLDGADALAHLDGGSDGRRALVSTMRAAIGAAKLGVIGTLANERTRIRSRLGEGSAAFDGVLELDRVTFPGDQVHHEVELEVPAGVDPKDAAAAFRALFHKAGVAGRESPGKARRFFMALRGEKLP